MKYMLVEILQNKPLKTPFSIDDIPKFIRTEMQQIIFDKCNVDLFKIRLILNDKKSENVIATYKQVYDKIFSLNFSPANVKSIITNEIMSDLFNVWSRTEDRVNFFSHMQKHFSAAQLTGAIANYMNDANMDDLLDFFFENRDKIFSVQRKIKTIALYYYSMFNNGIARFITLLTPILLDMGYKVVVITDEIDEERDYPLPQHENLKRVVIRTPYSNFLGRLEELTNCVKDYDIDLFCSHAYYGQFPPIFQILFFKFFTCERKIDYY